MAPSMRASRMSPARTDWPVRLCREKSFSAIVMPISRLRFGKELLHALALRRKHVAPRRLLGGFRVARGDRGCKLGVFRERGTRAVRQEHLRVAEKTHRVAHG